MTRAALLAPLLFVLGCGGGSSDPEVPDAPPSVPPDARVDAPPSCAPQTGAGTEHSTYVTTDETWTEADSPHIVTADIAIQNGATLTIETCAIVRMTEGTTTISLGLGGTEGTLIAHGAPGRFAGFGPRTGFHWGALRVFPTGHLDLEHAFTDGGSIVATGAGGGTLTRNVRAVNTLVTGSSGSAIDLSGGAAFTEDSHDLLVEASVNPISVAPPAVHTIPTGMFNDNQNPEILVTSAAIAVDEGFPARGVPYRLLGTFTMVPTLTEAEGGLATLTIDAGVTIKVPRSGGADNTFQLGNSNAPGPSGNWPVRLIADGTAAPIVFTSAEAVPAAGDWAGIDWGGAPATGNVVRNLTVEYAGGNSGTQGFGCGPLDNDAALIIRHWIPAAGTISGSTFRASAGGGIVSGWVTDGAGPDLKTGNTFSAIGNACDVSRWKGATTIPACPSAGVTPDCL